MTAQRREATSIVDGMIDETIDLFLDIIRVRADRPRDAEIDRMLRRTIAQLGMLAQAPAAVAIRP